MLTPLVSVEMPMRSLGLASQRALGAGQNEDEPVARISGAVADAGERCRLSRLNVAHHQAEGLEAPRLLRISHVVKHVHRASVNGLQARCAELS